MRLYTMGHGTASEETFVALLSDAGIARVVDVRTAPGSKRNPQFMRAAMERWLPDAGIAYEWEKELGGFRKADAESRNVALRHPAFRGYADHMREPSFWSALDRVLDIAAHMPTVVMCSESVWWRCHRRLLSDAAMLVRGVDVVHLMHDGRIVPHAPTEGVRREGELLVYDAGQGRLG